jgi:hypothetical protein
VVAEWNAQCDINERVKSVSQAYKGYQKGETRACDLMIQQVMKLQAAGYSILEIGHTKTKLKEDIISKVQFEQLTCNLDNKYYNALKDKVNLVAMCYWENVVENIEEKKNAFTKKMDKVGELTDRKRVMVFADDDNAIDTKTHFEYITHKIDLSAEGFIKAVEEAIAMKIASEKSAATTPVAKQRVKESEPVEETKIEEDILEQEAEIIEEDPEIEAMVEQIEEIDEAPFDLDEEEGEIDLEAMCNEIRAAFKKADATTKNSVKEILSEKGNGKLEVALGADILQEIAAMLGV